MRNLEPDLDYDLIRNFLLGEAEASDEAPDADEVARFFHETYERLAPEFSYKTRKASAVAWEDVPENNKELMVAVARRVIDRFMK